jgi:hypothetical protein
MRNYFDLFILVIFSFVSIIASGCSYIEIIRPSEESTYVISPYDFQVEHTGCGRVEPETFRAWLDKGTDQEEDITAAFSYSNQKWTASNFEIALGGHALTASASVDTGGWCFVGKGSDERQFFVTQPTCVKGKVIWCAQNCCAEGCPEGSEGEWSGAMVEARLSGTSHIIGQAITDQSGVFCFDNIPVAADVDIKIIEQSPPPGYGSGSCGGTVKKIRVLAPNKTCRDGNCEDIGTIKAPCFET